MIDVQRLRILRAVADHGSFNRAAAALRLTPSAVSQQVAALERALGTPVVVRSTRGVTFTEAGRVMVETATSISAELAHARARIDRLTEGRPKLTVATFTSGGRQLLPPALLSLADEHPEVEIHVVEREPEDSLPMVRRGAADLALAYHFDGPLPARPGDRSGLDWLPLTEDPLSVVLPAGHRLAGRDSLDLGELAAETWVMGCLKTAAYLRRYAESAGFELIVRGTTTDYFFARALVAAGVGISLVPSVALTPEQPGTVVVAIQPPGPARHIGIATARRGPSRPYAAALVRALRHAAESTATARSGSPRGGPALLRDPGERLQRSGEHLGERQFRGADQDGVGAEFADPQP